MKYGKPSKDLRDKVHRLSKKFDEYTVADRVGLSPKAVAAILDGPEKPRVWAAQCRKTGRVVTALSERGAYLKAQIAGFSDWAFVKPGEIPPPSLPEKG